MSRCTSRGVGQYAPSVPADTHVLVHDSAYAFDQTARGVLYLRSRGNTAAQVLDGLWGRAAEAAATVGLPVLAIDAGGTTTWAKDTTTGAAGRVVDGANYLRGACKAKAGQILGVGGSMGALELLQAHRANPGLFCGLALWNPVVSLASVRDGNLGGYQAEIDAALGGQANVASHDPAQHAADFAGLPLQLWRATNDPVVTQASVDAFAAAVGAEVRSLGASGHNPANVDPYAVIDFLAAHR